MLQPDKLTPAQRAKWDADHEAVNAPGFDPVAFHQEWLDNLTDEELAASRVYWRPGGPTVDDLRADHAEYNATADLVGERAAAMVRRHVIENQLADTPDDDLQRDHDWHAGVAIVLDGQIVELGGRSYLE